MEQKKHRWLLPALVAGALVLALGIGAALLWGGGNAREPQAAVEYALDSLEPLENPVSLGVLGQGELSGERFGVSGNWNLQAGEKGLAMSLTDFTLANEDGSTDLEFYLDPDAAALRIPALAGETWHGVALDRPLKTQGLEVLDGELLGWYFDDAKLSAAQTTVDALRTTLAGVSRLGLTDAEVETFQEFFRGLPVEDRREKDVRLLHFSATAEQMEALGEKLGLATEPGSAQAAELDLTLNKEDRLTALCVTAEAGVLSLELGDPDAPAPRLELQWGGDNSLELAFTLSPGAALTAPAYDNAFRLLLPAED